MLFEELNHLIFVFVVTQETGTELHEEDFEIVHVVLTFNKFDLLEPLLSVKFAHFDVVLIVETGRRRNEGFLLKSSNLKVLSPRFLLEICLRTTSFYLVDFNQVISREVACFLNFYVI